MQLTRSFWGEPEICHVVGTLCVTIMSNISNCVRVPLNGEGQQGQRVCGKSEKNHSGQKFKSSSYLVRLAQQVKATWEKAFRKPEKIKYI